MKSPLNSPFRSRVPLTLSISGFETEIYDLQSRIATLNGTVSTGSLSAANTLVKTLKSSGIWSKCQVIWAPIGDLNASRALLKWSTVPSVTYFNITTGTGVGQYSETNGVTGNANTGTSGNGSGTAYIDLGHKMGAISTDGKNLHMACNSKTGWQRREMGTFRSAVLTRHYLLAAESETQWAWGDRGGSGGTPSSSAAGLRIATRSTSGSALLYVNGNQIASMSTPDGSQPADWNTTLLVSSGSSTGASTESQILYGWSAQTLNFASQGTGLSASEASSYSSAVSTFNTTLGR